MEKLTAKVLSEPFQYEIPKIKGSRFITTLIPISSKEKICSKLEKTTLMPPIIVMLGD